MTTELRVPREADLDAFLGVLGTAFGGALQVPEEREKWRALAEPDRFLAAWDEDEIVGTAGAFTFRLTVPGGTSVPTAGVTMVSVLPTHRRRGILRSMMRRQLDDVRAWGEPLAVLTASEPEIYGRFGYGVATGQLTARIDTSKVRLALPAGTDDLRVRLVDAYDGGVRERCEALYAERVPLRPGMLARRPGWERVAVHDPEQLRAGASPMQCVLVERDGDLRGYARYAVRAEWDAAGPKGEVLLRNMEALEPAALGALMRYLFDIDLTTWLTIGNRPVDDAWLHMVSDVRRCEIGHRDSLHLRLVDVGAALEARTYAAPVDVVFDVADDFCPWNEGRWRLTGDTKGAACTRTDDAPDLALSVRELGAAYLGGVTLGALAGAGRVREVEWIATSLCCLLVRWL
ncbi:GNAT family N-acetyltransferase [Streptomyces armeniacus]|uniref:GNAT family N-acetyltransferase n=1 Tax=Streptomyces armeniacus TaxID=83291 RepID=A0A345XR91_9ACTN|nr:GNAT family N-acetyltransferase [Streptomyces armeniacus]AXK34157.1 GNAT family N-acetyltransferase [Streptomyces armeniacus]